jgi:hypothetical protein
MNSTLACFKVALIGEFESKPGKADFQVLNFGRTRYLNKRRPPRCVR